MPDTTVCSSIDTADGGRGDCVGGRPAALHSVGLRLRLDDEDVEAWSAPPSRQTSPPAIARTLLERIGAVLADQIYISGRGLPSGLVN